MGTDKNFIDYILDQLSGINGITAKKMFGEYAVYLNGKVVALVCDNQLFIKPTDKGRAYIGDVTEAPAYPGAKPSFLVQDMIDDREWLAELFLITENELPLPKPKKKKR